MYDTGIKKSVVFKTKTICIGNLSVGGTGKTPMVEYLIRHLKNDYKIAVLSRGYKRKSDGFLLADAQSTVSTLGDEPFQIHKKFLDIAVAVDANRRNGISILEQKIEPDVILLDDAFQHRKVTAGFNVLLTAYGKLYCDDWYLPSGNLRDSRREAKRADVIVVTKCPSDISLSEQEAIRYKLNPDPVQDVLFSTLVYGDSFYGKSDTIGFSDLKNMKVTLVTGIADPEPLTAYLLQQGLLFEHLSYPDHHFFTAEEKSALNEKEVVLTTEKDFMRLEEAIERLYYLPVRHEFLGKNRMETSLDGFMKRDI